MTASSPPLAGQMARKICAFDRQHLTQAALACARTAITDTIGVTLAGHAEACTAILRRVPGLAAAPGPCLIFASRQRTSALDATMVNGCASHALDYDDFSGAMGGHQSVPLVSLLFALGEDRRASGMQILLAYAVGVETEIRLARAVNFHHYDKGWHPTATLGTIGAAASAAHLLDLDEARTATALAIAASLASGIKANFGTMVKPLHVGQCARNGLFAALLAEGGYDANPEAFEHHQGFLNVFNGPGNYDASKILRDWGAPLEIEHPSIALKQFPCCGSTHPAISVMLDLVRAEDIRPDDVAGIEVLAHARRLRHTDNPDPQTALEAKFSHQYVIARALLDRAVKLKDFEADAHFDPAIRQLLERIEARPHPDMAEDGPEQWGAEVIVTLNGGRRVSRRVDNLVGRGGENAMSQQELWEKFSDCAERTLPRGQIFPLFDRLGTLQTETDISGLVKLLEGAPG
jgi:2-methylcitrate dehydratase PrpD